MIGALGLILAVYGSICGVGFVLLVVWEWVERRCSRDPLERIWRLPAAEVHEIRGRRS